MLEHKKELHCEDLEQVSGGSSDGGFTCKNCGNAGQGHHWVATYQYRNGRGDLISRTVPICDNCYPTLQNNDAYSNWKEKA